MPDAEDIQHGGRLAIGADPGASGVTAASYWRQQPDGTWVIFDEYYHDASKGYHIGEEAHAEAILEKHGLPDVGVCDPAGGDLYYQLRKRCSKFQRARKDVLGNISHLDTSFRSGVVKVLAGSCPNGRDELGSWEWDHKAAERGEDAPVKGGDHWIDTVLYLARAVIPKRRATANSVDGLF